MQLEAKRTHLQTSIMPWWLDWTVWCSRPLIWTSDLAEPHVGVCKICNLWITVRCSPGVPWKVVQAVRMSWLCMTPEDSQQLLPAFQSTSTCVLIKQKATTCIKLFKHLRWHAKAWTTSTWLNYVNTNCMPTMRKSLEVVVIEIIQGRYTAFPHVSVLEKHSRWDTAPWPGLWDCQS